MSKYSYVLICVILHDDNLHVCLSGQDGAATAPLCLKETQIYGAQLENLNELRAPDAERAGLYLDAALTSSQKIRGE